MDSNFNSTLDQNLVPGNQPSYLKIAMTTGLYIALASVVIGLLTYLTGYSETLIRNSALQWVNNLLSLGILFFFIYSACIKHRNENLGGYISYGRCLGLGTLSGLFSGLIVGIWTIIFMQFIAPDMTDMILGITQEKLAESGMGEDMIENQINITKKFMTPLPLFGISLLSSIFMAFLVSLVAGAFARKNQPFNL
ncbi:MAG: DUF4199 family protein [Bacteroidetes bacterium]|nr:DUF4199 family protein [Bacteroidota bacterium]